ncbi:Malignant T-cell-amplified sequence 1 [Perkinsus chesapeaki]|uniref:Malignant T-cell-amplified sequence 1 n=1 Tax=Perkinsus chesapeaki TaxID=330153 RepID=A0A7J6LJZ2_PERCH|nr:Malignant T-cell-amplified sequence 1 [Perkinsus chesapeaki]
MVGSVASSWNESVHRAWLHYVKKERERAELMELIRDARDAGVLPPKADVSTQNQAKSSVARGVKAKVAEDFPRMEECVVGLFPKKAQNVLVKCKDHVQLFAVNGEVLFFQLRDGPWIPTLRTVHRFPTMMPLVRVDRGAIKFVLKGANIMTPGLTSPGGALPEHLEKDQIVAVLAEGKEHICAIGKTLMSADEM